MTQLRSALCLSMVLTALTVLSACSSGSDEVPAAPQQGPTLSGHAVLPAASFITAPADAPPVLHTSGRDALSDLVRHSLSAGDPLPGRLQQAGAIRDPDGRVVFPGQPLQGFSGIRSLGGGRFLVTSDNGYGGRTNSADAMLMVHELQPDWQAGQVRRIGTRFLHDPDRVLPFPIVHQDTSRRYLTGADLDIESVQVVGDHLWFGDEFGPYLLKTDRQGKVVALYESRLEGRILRSPEHFAIAAATAGDAAAGSGSAQASLPEPQVFRSQGFEGMARSADGRFLYPMLEGPLRDDASRQRQQNGRHHVHILEFDLHAEDWTGRHWRYPLEEAHHAIGDFNIIDAAGNGLVVERDARQGEDARFKRIHRINLQDRDADGFLRKRAHIDLLDIADPEARARTGRRDGRFSFPFFTIENVDRVDEQHIIVANDNNLPFSDGRQPGQPDDNEFILLRVPRLLAMP